MKSLIACGVAAAATAGTTSTSVSAFATFSKNTHIPFLLQQQQQQEQQSAASTPLSTSTRPLFLSTRLNLQQEGDDEADERSGMEDAFSSLNDLSSLDMSMSTIGTPAKSSESKLLANLDSIDFDIDIDAATTELEKGGDAMSEDEINLYKDMYKEIQKDNADGGTGDDIYGDILGEMSGTKTKTNAKASASATGNSAAGKGFGKPASASKPKPKPTPLVDADGIGSINQDSNEQLTAVELSQDTDEFMRRAIEEALEDANEIVETKGAAKIDMDTVVEAGVGVIPENDVDSILNDAELMKEINAVFDRANDKLLDGISDIRKEQEDLSKASALTRDSALEKDETRLEEAEQSVSRLVDKVKKETLEVEKAVNDLRIAQEGMSGDALGQAVNLKKAGLVKQSAVVGAILFSFRSVGELLLVTQGIDAEGHTASAAIQGLIALACGAYLVFF